VIRKNIQEINDAISGYITERERERKRERERERERERDGEGVL